MRCWAIALGVVLTLTSCNRSSHPWAIRLLAQPLEIPPAEVRQFLDKIVVGTVYEHRIVVNAAPRKPEDVVILFLGKGTSWRWPHSRFQGMCQALSGEQTIVCDAAYFSTYLVQVLGRRPEASSIIGFQTWVLGHELGHIAQGDEGAHFSGTYIPTRIELRNLEQQRKEYRADCWMVQRLLAVQDGARIFGVERTAIDFINSRVRKVSRNPPMGVGIIFDYATLDPYDFRGFSTHPDMLLRATRILHVSADERNDEALEGMVAPLIRKLVPDPLWDDEGPCAQGPR